MAVDYEQWQKAPGPEQAIQAQEARARLDSALASGASKVTDVSRLVKDVYLLDKVGGHFDDPTLLQQTKVLAGHPRIFTGVLDVLRHQDTEGDSVEVLASLHVARKVDYDQTDPRGDGSFPLRVVFDTLDTKHVALIEEAEKQRKAAEAEARRKARTEWPAELLTVNTGKSQEWMNTQQMVADRWEAISRTLPQGVARETPEAAVAYFKAGIGLLGEYMLAAGTPSTNNALYYRAALEYLIPQTWLQPRLVKTTLEKWAKGVDLQGNDIGSSKPTDLKGVNVVAKTFFVTPSLHNLTTKPNEDQKRQINSLHRAYQFALHPDVANRSDVNPALTPHIETVHKAVNSAWRQMAPLVR